MGKKYGREDGLCAYHISLIPAFGSLHLYNTFPCHFKKVQKSRTHSSCILCIIIRRTWASWSISPLLSYQPTNQLPIILKWKLLVSKTIYSCISTWILRAFINWVEFALYSVIYGEQTAIYLCKDFCLNLLPKFYNLIIHTLDVCIRKWVMQQRS